MSELYERTALELHQMLQRGEVSPSEATQHYLDRSARLNPVIGAFATITADAASRRAQHVAHAVPTAAPLWGMPLADKDLQVRAGVPTAFGSRAFVGFVSDESDAMVRDIDDAGAVSLGKTATPEFGLPAYTETLVGPPARNPWNLALGAGGSSGGAAAAVAAGMLPFAPGSDGGGSIRIPASVCGIVGVKPSRGRVPGGSGLGSLGGLGVAGPLARNVADAALLLDGMVAPRGYPPAQRFSVSAPGDAGPYLGAAVRGEGRFQVGVLADTPWDDGYDISVDEGHRGALELAVGALDALGHGVEAIPTAPEPGFPGAFRTIWQAGAAAIPVDGEQLQMLEPLSRWLVERGRSVSARALADALAWLSGFEQRVISRFASYDVVITPALAQPARPVGWFDAENGERNFAQQVQLTPFTSFVNVAGLPAVSLPVMHDVEEGPPLSVQLIGRPGGEATLFAVAAQLERRLGASRRPSL